MEPRIQIAAMAMQGLVSSAGVVYLDEQAIGVLAKTAVACADALLAELLKTSADPAPATNDIYDSKRADKAAPGAGREGSTGTAGLEGVGTTRAREDSGDSARGASSALAVPCLARDREPAPVVEDFLESLCSACGGGKHGECARGSCGCTDTEACRARQAARAIAPEKPEVPGDDPDWWWAKLGAGWHLWHERCDDSFCHEEEAGPHVALDEKPTPAADDPNTVCLECQEARCPAAMRWRAARDLEAKHGAPKKCVAPECPDAAPPGAARTHQVCALHSAASHSVRMEWWLDLHPEDRPPKKKRLTPPKEGARRARKIRDSLEDAPAAEAKAAAHG
jgi:hypothetical protein